MLRIGRLDTERLEHRLGRGLSSNASNVKAFHQLSSQTTCEWEVKKGFVWLGRRESLGSRSRFHNQLRFRHRTFVETFSNANKWVTVDLTSTATGDIGPASWLRSDTEGCSDWWEQHHLTLCGYRAIWRPYHRYGRVCVHAWLKPMRLLPMRYRAQNSFD